MIIDAKNQIVPIQQCELQIQNETKELIKIGNILCLITLIASDAVITNME